MLNIIGWEGVEEFHRVAQKYTTPESSCSDGEVVSSPIHESPLFHESRETAL